MNELLESIKDNAGVNEESMTLGVGADGMRLKESQTNALRVIQDAWSKYAKNNKIVQSVGYQVGPVRVASKILAGLKNPKLAKYEKMAAKLVGEYDKYRKGKVSDAQIK